MVSIFGLRIGSLWEKVRFVFVGRQITNGTIVLMMSLSSHSDKNALCNATCVLLCQYA